MDIRLCYSTLLLLTIIDLFTYNSNNQYVVQCTTATADSPSSSSIFQLQRRDFATITESQIKNLNRNLRQTLEYHEIAPPLAINEHNSHHHHYRHETDEYFGRNGTDNRKPAFYGCKDYAPRVKEEQPSNTYVIKVHAEDPDDFDEITYSFEKSATERAKFRMNPKTGEIVTSYTFDRDEPIREKEVCSCIYFFVRF